MGDVKCCCLKKLITVSCIDLKQNQKQYYQNSFPNSRFPSHSEKEPPPVWTLNPILSSWHQCRTLLLRSLAWLLSQPHCLVLLPASEAHEWWDLASCLAVVCSGLSIVSLAFSFYSEVQMNKESWWFIYRAF